MTALQSRLVQTTIHQMQQQQQKLRRKQFWRNKSPLGKSADCSDKEHQVKETGVNPVQAYPYCKRGRRITAIVRQDEKAFLG